MKNAFAIFMIFLLIVGFGVFLMKSSENSSGNTVNNGENSGSGNFQKVTLGIKNGNYYPNTVTVEVNKPVRVYLDSSVTGCFRSFTMRDFGIAKNLPTPNDYVEFTPSKTGSFRFACSMGMGTGTLIVK
ncbi:MAG: cupredoxin domain-containing protein [archaeon]|nr:cupredoxin domain-containing protein [archaeon]